ncbi:MAG: carboxypeptidase regulatory-like domain-containing protein [Chitinispirillaceae bacterium]|nr:carboxypeptidase regulatory-like domain-containing protein [Chitinispirillaceae bacterium]
MKFVRIPAMLAAVLFLHGSTGAAMNLRGIVIDYNQRPILGAVVTLSGGRKDTTDSSGRFEFIAAEARKRTAPVSAPEYTLRAVNHSLLLRTSSTGKVKIELFGLDGRLIVVLHNGILRRGEHRFGLPGHEWNRVFTVRYSAGSETDIMRFAGSAAGVHNGPSPAGTAEPRSAAAVPDEIRVTRDGYDETTVAVTGPDDSLTIQLCRLLDIDTVQTVAIGEPLCSGAAGVSIVLDSIHDERCGCDEMCIWEGNAWLYFSLSIGGTVMPLVLESYDKRELFTGNYSLRLTKINNCRTDDNPDDYSVTMGVFASDPEKRILFVEHFDTKAGTVISGTDCHQMNIDFPTYSFNEKARTLRCEIAIPDTVRIIFGSGTSLNGAAGSGIASQLYCIGMLPATVDANCSVDSVTSDGTVFITYKERAMVLSPGAMWRHDTTYIEASENCEASITEGDRIENFGFISRDMITTEF